MADSTPTSMIFMWQRSEAEPAELACNIGPASLEFAGN